MTAVDFRTSTRNYVLRNYGRGSSGYDASKKYGLFLGEYRLQNIPEKYPLGLVGAAVDIGNVTYTGDATKLRTRVRNSGETVTKYYFGEVTVLVQGDFGTDLGLASYYGSSVVQDGYNKFVFSEVCDVGWAGYNTIDMSGARYVSEADLAS